MALAVCKVSCGMYTLRNWYNCEIQDDNETFHDLYARLASGEIDGIGLPERHNNAKVTVTVANGVAQKCNTEIEANRNVASILPTVGKYVEFIISDDIFSTTLSDKKSTPSTVVTTNNVSLEALLTSKKFRTRACKEELKSAVIDWLKNNN